MVSTALTVPQTDPQADGKGGQSFEAADITEAQAQEDASPPPASMQSVASSMEAPMMSLMRKVKVTAPCDPCYCEDCKMWLAGPTQWERHKVGGTHKRHVRRAARNQGFPEE